MRNRITNRALLLSAAIILTFALAGCKMASLVSTSDEVSVGRQAAAQIEAEYPVSKDAAMNQLVNNIGQNLLSNVEIRPGITYSFKVLDVNDINAFALPGGWIYVYKGLIDEVKGNTDELAGVIAHEIGHVQARHHAEMMGRSTLYGVAIGALTKGNASQWASLFANVEMLRYSRKDEFEADRLAIDYTYPSRYNSQGLINFFKVLQSKEGKGGSVPKFLRTHPLTADRIAAAQAHLDQKKTAAGK